MRVVLAFAFAFALAFVLPSVLAAGYEVQGDRTLEGALDAAGAGSFRLPIVASEDGAIYAKLLDAPGNSAYANGSWSVAFAVERADGSKAPLGSFHDGTPTALVPAKSGESLVVVADVHAPRDAAKGGAKSVRGSGEA